MSRKTNDNLWLMSKKTKKPVDDNPITMEDMQKALFQDRFGELKRYGLTFKRFCEQMNAELEATDKKTSCNQGEWSYSDDLVDWKTRQKARDDLGRVLGVYEKDNKQKVGDGQPVLILTDDPRAKGWLTPADADEDDEGDE